MVSGSFFQPQDPSGTMQGLENDQKLFKKLKCNVTGSFGIPDEPTAMSHSADLEHRGFLNIKENEKKVYLALFFLHVKQFACHC